MIQGMNWHEYEIYDGTVVTGGVRASGDELNGMNIEFLFELNVNVKIAVI